MKNKPTQIVLSGKLSSRWQDHEDKESSMNWKVFSVGKNEIDLYSLLDGLEGDNVKITIETVQEGENDN